MKHVRLTDETLRDGSQGSVVMTPAFKIKHLLKMEKNCWANKYRLGWHSNPTDQKVLDWVSQFRPEIVPKIAMPTLLAHPEKPNHAFEQYCQDDRFGMASVFTKGREEDIADLGLDKTQLLKNIHYTVGEIRSLRPTKPIELGIEHFFSSFLEGGEEFLIQSIETALCAGAESIIIADTDGALLPFEIKKTILHLSQKLKRSKPLMDAGIIFTPDRFTIHTHDDLKLGAANIIAALEVGVTEVDTSLNHYGERAGNTPLLHAIAAINHHSKFKCDVSKYNQVSLEQYALELHKDLGTKVEDKGALGSKNSFNAVGGMHADKLLKEFRKLKKERGLNIERFTGGLGEYEGAYNSVSASEFGKNINVTLSPVAGRSNVLFMLELLGISGISKSDVRLKEVLTIIKNDELEKGINYRGRNNSNAILLVANKFGARNLPDGDEYFKLELSRNRRELLVHILVECYRFSLPRFDEAEFLGGELKLVPFAGSILNSVVNCLEDYFESFGDIQIYGVRNHPIEVGDPRMLNGEIVGTRSLQSVKLLFTGTQGEEWQSAGTGKTVLEAFVWALQKGIDYKLFLYERRSKLRQNHNWLEDKDVFTTTLEAAV